MTPAPALDLTTSLRGDFVFSHHGHHGGRSDSNSDLNPPPPPPKLFGPCGGRGLSWGSWGRPVGGVPGTPTHIPQNDPPVALIVLNTHMRGF